MESIADYDIVRLLGRANYGDFYLAKTPPRLPIDDKFVVIKVATGPASDDAFRRATRELRHLALARSPQIVSIFDAGRQGNAFFYAMEYLPLGSLEYPVHPLSRNEKLRAVADAAEGAHTLHEHGIAHRDIKPANILLHDHGAKLSDLGLSQLLSPGMVMTGLGSIDVEFIDPAILTGADASRATDVWALGAVLHRALTGVSLYENLPSAEPLLIVRAVLSSTAAVDPSLGTAERELVRSCIADDPADRPSTAAKVARSIRALIEA